MKEIEQIKDSYGNLIKVWGIYEITSKLEKSPTYPKKSVKRKLISTFPSLKEAKLALEELE